MIKDVIFFSLLFVVLILVVFFMPLSAGQNQVTQISNPMFDPFGGQVEAIIPCTCQYTAWMNPQVVTIGPPKGGTFLMTIFAHQYSHYAVSMGNNVLGLASKFQMPCMQTAGLACSEQGQYEPIWMVGTSGF